MNNNINNIDNDNNNQNSNENNNENINEINDKNDSDFCIFNNSVENASMDLNSSKMLDNNNVQNGRANNQINNENNGIFYRLINAFNNNLNNIEMERNDNSNDNINNNQNNSINNNDNNYLNNYSENNDINNINGGGNNISNENSINDNSINNLQYLELGEANEDDEIFDSLHNINEDRKKFVDNLLEYELNKVDELEETNKKCVICLELFKNGDKIISLPCIHIYHGECIKKWLLNNYFCPLCKYEFHENGLN